MKSYMLWADSSIWKIVNTLSDEEFEQQFDNHVSIREKYLHMAEGHSGWYHRWTSIDQDDLNPRNLPKDELFEFLSNYNQKILDLLQERAQEIKEINTSQGKLQLSTEEMVFNIINHATYHRGQIVLMLRMLEKEVNPTDYLPFRIDTAFE